MKVFVTGASGFIGSAVVQELLSAGHSVIGLARSEASSQKIKEAGAEVLTGGLEDLDTLKKGALQADGVVHTAFIHDFSQYEKAAATDKAAIEAMGEVLKGTAKPIVVTGGILGLPKTKGFVTEADAAPGFPRASEAAAMALSEQGINASAIRLPPSVHDKGDKGFVPMIINTMKEKGFAAYVGDGNNRWPAVHRLDAAYLFRLALEKGAKGARYNAIGDEGIPIKQLAELVGKHLGMPVKSITPEEATGYFTWMAYFIQFDNPATSFKTIEALNWKPAHIGLLEDMKQHYF